MRVKVIALLLLAAGVAAGSHLAANRVHVGRHAVDVAAGPAPCAAQRHLHASELVPGWRMGAIQFLSPSVGIGITAGWSVCGRQQSRLVPAHLWLAVSRDGGSTWQVRGRPLPASIAPHQTGLIPHLVAASTSQLWVLTADGRVLSTLDGGANWRKLPLPTPVVQLLRADGFLWALSCARRSDSVCVPVLERARPGHAWVRVTLPRLAAMPDPVMTVSRLAVIVNAQRYPSGRGVLMLSRDGGRFKLRPAPSWDGHPCTIGAWLTSAGRRTWLMCLGGAAAGSSTKGLLASDDGGHTWRTVSAVADLTRPTPAWAISNSEPSAVGTGSAERLWAAWQNGFSESQDGGSRWRYLRNINPQGISSLFSVLSPTHAWLLTVGAALWRTTDGVHWRLIDAFDPSVVTSVG